MKLSAELFLCPPPHSCMKRSNGRHYFHFLAQAVASEVLAPLLGQFCVVLLFMTDASAFVGS